MFAASTNAFQLQHTGLQVVLQTVVSCRARVVQVVVYLVHIRLYRYIYTSGMAVLKLFSSANPEVDDAVIIFVSPQNSVTCK